MTKLPRVHFLSRSKKTRSLFKIMSGFVLCCIAGCGAMDVSSYNGDGVIAVTGKNFINAGYVVDFDSFSLGEEFSAEYKIEGLPKINASLSARMVLSSVDVKLEEMQGATIGISLEADGEVLYEYDGPLSGCRQAFGFISYIYCRGANGYDVDAAITDSKDKLILRVNYKPGDNLLDAKAFFRLARGGHY